MKSRRTLSGKPGASNHEIAQVLKQNIDLADSKNVPESTFGVAKRLLHISELPSCYHLKYIEHGYRPHNQSVVDAFFSAFYFHNQTVNTWTHLIGFLMCFAIFVDLLVQAKFEGDDAFFAYFSISASICFLFSSLYHWFQCVSEDCRHTLLRLDLTGAIIHVVADFIGVFYYGFYCHPYYQRIYYFQALVTFIVGLFSAWSDAMLWGVKIGPLMFAFLCLVGLIPMYHWYSITDPDIVRAVGPGYLGMFCSNGFGFIFYISRVPERLFPNSFIATQLIPSHAIWHLFGLAAAFFMLDGLVKYRDIMEAQGGCPDQSS